ncbi:MAG TPA: hypothetical protein PLZ15_10080 [Melioribacteraceae bacterium]|nr:hypothetical protein [Melioribacteraceae bacterium]
MNLASIDIGSNTILLLIAEYSRESEKLTPLLNCYEAPRISAQLSMTNLISAEKIDLMMDILGKYKALIEENKVEITKVVATKAFRTAENGNLTAKTIREKFNWDVEILSGEDEARLSFLGSIPFSNPAKKFLVVDIGGGSTELIYGSELSLSFRKSYDFGAVSLTEKHSPNNPLKITDIKKIKKTIIENAGSIRNNFSAIPEMIAVAGTPTTLSCIKQGLKTYNEDLVENSLLTTQDLREMIDMFSKYSNDEILNKFGDVVTGREDIILTGTIILLTIADLVGIDTIKVSTRGLRYGILIDYLTKFRLE